MNRLIRLAYRKVIDASATAAWDRTVFDETYRELYMQAQRYDQAGQYQTLAELLAQVPGADKLHYLTSRAAVGYLKQLDQRLPDVVDSLGSRWVPFTEFTFEVLASHLHRSDAHRIAIVFYSDPLLWLDTIGDQLLLATADQQPALQAGQFISTHLLTLDSQLSIWTYQTGSRQTGSRQTGSRQTGSIQTGSIQPESYQTGSRQTSPTTTL